MTKERWLAIAGSGFIFVAVLVAYSPALRGEFLWDDDGHVTKPELRSVGGLIRIWTELGATQQYYPLLHSAFWFEHKLWGDSVVGYHVVNVLLQATNACLLWVILKRLQIPGAYLAACVFAFHPVHVESVAWITELKNTLSLGFYLAATLLYLRFDETRDDRAYTWAFVLFIAGLLSKSVVATFPAAMLVIIWWKRGRISWDNDVRPLIRFFAVAVIAGCVTAFLERKLIGAEGEEFELTWLQRLQLSGRVVWFYLSKLFWPTQLTFIYPRWELDRSPAWYWAFLGSLVALALVFWLLRNRTRAPLAALLLFVGSLVPVLGFFNVYPFRYSFVADHFQYLPSIAIIVLVCAAVAAIGRTVEVSAGVVLVIALGVLTWRQAHMYRDVQTLYLTTLERNPQCWMAHTNLGVYYVNHGRADDAKAQYEAALAIRADDPEALSNLGSLHAEQGRPLEAIAYLERAAKAKPQSAAIRINLGNALVAANRIDDAVAAYEQAIRLDPDNLDAMMSLIAAYEAAEQPTAAIATAQRALAVARRIGNKQFAEQIEQSLAAYRRQQQRQ
jgi:tetratricopeptide (TPR) repeat protein